MGRERVIIAILVVSIIINIALLSYVFLNDSPSRSEEEGDLKDKEENDSKEKKIEFEEFQYSEFALTEGETLINGKYSFNYSTAGWSISVRDLEDDRLVCHFWCLEEGGIYGSKLPARKRTGVIPS
jgi:hypothetical protein